MYKIKVDDLEFVGYEQDCWKFIICFLDFDMRDRYQIHDLEDFDGVYLNRGKIIVENLD